MENQRVNPYKKRSAKVATKAGPKSRYGAAQDAFNRHVRNLVETDPKFFEKNHWHSVSYRDSRHKAPLISNGKMSVDAFYVKDVAVWVPHLIIKGYIPSCGKCRSKESVNLGSCRWVENPKLLYGVNSHRYFDTMYYRCMKCGSDFTGWHENTLATDANEIAGVLNYRMSRGFAVDAQLYSFIVNHNNDTTASIHQKLKGMLADKWMADATFYYRAVLSKQVKASNPKLLEGTNQQKLDAGYFKAYTLTDEQKRARRTRDELRQLTAEYESI